MNQFRIDGFQLYRLDRCSHGGGLILYIRDNISAKGLKQYKLPTDIEAIIIEINLWKRKWLLCGNYNHHEGSISYHLENISKLLDFYLSKYDNILVLGDFNYEETANSMNDFLCTYNLKTLVEKPTCFKNVNNPSIIDLILNKNKSFYRTDVLETELSDFHKLVFTILKSSYIKLKRKMITYRGFKSFDVEAFRNNLLNSLHAIPTGDITYTIFEGIYLNILDIHAPFKQKYVRGNNQPFMTKSLRKAIMVRTKLKNIYYRLPTDENLRIFKKQRNYLTKLKGTFMEILISVR